jgi:pimeloyl-[acyl-carrier protein] methyl ester esterase
MIIKTRDLYPSLVVISGWAMPASLLHGMRTMWPGNVMLLDLPGVGQAKNTILQPDLALYAQTLLARVPTKAIWLGWSLGGLIAQYIALHYPEQVLGLINISSSPKFMQDGTQWAGLRLDVVEKMAEDLRHDLKTTLRRFLSLQFHGVKNPPSDLWLRFERWMALDEWANAEAVQHGLTLLLQSDLRQELQQLTMPVLFIYGDKDAIVPRAQAQQLQPFIPQAQIVRIAQAGHMPLLSHHNECKAILSSFMAKTVLRQDSYVS